MRRSVTGSVRPAAGLGGTSLTRSAVAVHAAVVTLYSTVQNVLNVLNYQVNGHCRKHEGRLREWWSISWLPETNKYNPWVVYDSSTYQDCLRHVELSHLHISSSVRNTTTVKHNQPSGSDYKKPFSTKVCQAPYTIEILKLFNDIGCFIWYYIFQKKSTKIVLCYFF